MHFRNVVFNQKMSKMHQTDPIILKLKINQAKCILMQKAKKNFGEKLWNHRHLSCLCKIYETFAY